MAFSTGLINAAELYPIGGGECGVDLDVPEGFDWETDGICVYVWGPCKDIESEFGDVVDGHNPDPNNPDDGNGPVRW